MFAELHCTSAFSFLTGASQPEELVAQAHKLGYSALALTDECSLAGVVRAHQAARQCGLKLIIGSRFCISVRDQVAPLSLILLAPDRQGYTEIAALITKGRRRSPKGGYSLQWDDVERLVRRPIGIWLPTFNPDADALQARLLSEHFGERLWQACELLQEDHDGSRYHYLYKLACDNRLPMVACNDVHMHVPERQPLQDIMTAIRLKTCVQQLGRKRFINAERHLRHPEQLRRIYPPALLEESLHISDLCQFSLEELRYQYPEEVVPTGLSPSDYLRSLVYEGAARRWPEGIPARVRDLLEKELILIGELKYEYYFLTVHDIVLFARQRNILCQGRGSAANSAVCYCLFITEVDPSRSQLLFERFLSRERDEPPDIDVDFEHERREEVIQYLYRKYGRERAALAATVISYRLRSAVRDVGRALGIDNHCLEVIARQLAWWDRPEELPDRFREAGLQDSRLARLYIALVRELLGFPRHLSQHVGGFVITREPVHTLVPIENAAMPERTIIQWDKDDLESLGLMKVDVLALGMLTAIRKTLDKINDYSRKPITLQDIPADDTATYDMLCKGDSVGVFQVESRAQMNMLPRLRPRTFYDLVIQVAIVRPGPIQGDMVHPYLRRRNGQEEADYPDERIREVLVRTLGVPIFQEQVIQLAMVAAGFSGGEADQLRRAMARWGKSGELLQFEDKLITGLLQHGYSMEYARRMFEQMKGFGGYGFPESHSASFALLVYVSAWLKRHHTSAFYCGLLNSLPMGFYSASQLVQDARRHGIEVRPVDVLCSRWEHSLEETHRVHLGVQPALRLGLSQIKGFSEAAAQRVIEAREKKPLRSLQDLCTRARLDQHSRQALVQGNALLSLTGHRYQSHWEMLAVKESTPLLEHEQEESLRDGVALDAPRELDSMLADYARLGLTLGRHPMALARHEACFGKCLRHRDLRHARSGQLVRVAGLVTNRQRPQTASGILFMTLEDETGNTNVIVHKAVQKKFRQALLGGTLLIIKGTVEKSPEGMIHLVAGHLSDHSSIFTDLVVKSRDFH